MTSIASPLSSCSDLKRFFAASPQIDEVLKHSHESFSETARAAQMLNGRWYVCQMATAPFRNIIALFLQALASFAAYMNLQSLETTLKEKIVFLQEGFIDKRLANIHIADSSNRYDPKTRFHVAIDSEVFNMIEKRYEDLDRQIKWTSLSQGVCQGMSIWFLYLYFKTRASFQDPKAHIACLTNLFANQAGVEANLLQIFKLKEVLEFLDLRIDLESCESKHSLFFQGEDEFSLCSLKLQTTQNSEETENIIKQLNQLPNGAYIIRVPIHSCVYIKTENYVFFFDPSAGTVAINVDSPNYNLGLFRFLTIQAIHYENLAFNKVFNKVVEELNLSPSQANILSSSELKNMIEEITANSPNIKFIPISTAQTFYP